MVDELRVHRLLRWLTDRIADLSAEAGADEQRRADPMWLRGVKYLFITAVEAGIDVAQHVCAAEGWGPPNTNRDAMLVLARHGVVSRELGHHMADAVGFRNVLVHRYVDVDDAIVVTQLGELHDLRDFVRSVLAFLEKASEAQGG
ncbi:DUF86 domain-containing protein [Geodermatophilus sp. TF02-6]|uniref:type VII toxin-antitoxin system HepT family RNase toxin n=1 Tax=Geodermatophilus sp. TF02-6 TaxID=2250575 RepID=UPI000DE9A7F0|nr:DUF86 domain-containing protein [Geodermatophilus sp. TF02-6]RBY77759.1 DUF86 domain-containing protein [Geodermatophilus sp. TF02-6]